MSDHGHGSVDGPGYFSSQESVLYGIVWYCMVVGYQAGTEQVTSLVSQSHCGLSDLFCIDCSCIYFMY